MTKLTIEIKEQEHNMETRVKREHGMDASEIEVQMARIILDILEAALNRKLLGELWELATGEMIQVVAEDGVEAASSANRQQQGDNEEEK
jgi:hypothetical protein